LNLFFNQLLFPLGKRVEVQDSVLSTVIYQLLTKLPATPSPS
jgi:hypothetical protein